MFTAQHTCVLYTRSINILVILNFIDVINYNFSIILVRFTYAQNVIYIHVHGMENLKQINAVRWPLVLRN